MDKGGPSIKPSEVRSAEAELDDPPSAVPSGLGLGSRLSDDISSRGRNRKRGYSLIQEKNLEEVFEMFSKEPEPKATPERKETDVLSEDKIQGLVEMLTGSKPRGSIVKDLMNEFSTTKSGKLDYVDFVSIFETKLSKQESDLENAFKMFDQNGDGRISFDEAKRTLKALGENMNDDQIRELIRQGDKTGDGTINYEEFKTFFGVLP